EVGIQTAIGPRVFIGREYLARTDLIRFGSLVEYQAFLRMPEVEARAFEERYDGTAREDRARIRTADDQARSLIRAYGSLADFLGLVGLTALLLGGVGVASAVHVFVKEKLTTVAMLRCLGATQRSVFVAYLLQAGLLGFAGATAGVVAGVGLQAVLPALLAQHLPVPVEFHLEPWPVITGLGIGVWVAALFSVLPLLSVRNVAPLQALRRDVESAARQLDPARWLAGAALVASVVALSVWQAPNTPVGLWYATGLIATTTALWGTAALLIRATRRFFPARAPYVVRQGIANLFRPRNQTVVVTLSIGFGVFLLGTLYLVQHNLLAYLDFGDEAARPSILLFDVQPDQRAGIDALVRARGLPPLDVTPLVPARIAAVNGRSVEELIRLDDGARWALRREYRNTYRDTLGAAESLVAGEWWDVDAGADAGSDPVYRISVDDELARSLGVGIGDRITWDVQGVQVESRISSLRSVDWTALSPNFFVIFEPGSLDRAPQTLVALGRVEDPTVRAELQRDIVIEYPNVSVLDLAVVQETVDAIAARVALGIRALALFTLAGGVLVLAGAIATSRYQRRRESALLRALGASRGQIARVLLTEYTALGSLAALTGLLLACVAAWLLTERLFNLEFTVPPIAIVAIWSAVVALTLIIGAVNSRDVLRRPPIEVLQEAAD
ncbi:MAG TPA: FtsX-like permease family protein, partial [Longimicrobiales bacterium]|nr:FtsX-like permease family protein [Longimicrobiales bacterium]